MIFEKTDKFCRYNCLKLNSGKTHFLVIISCQKRTYHDTNFSLQFGDSVVEASKEERILGVQVGDSLCSWKPQVNFSSRIVQKCSKKLAGLYKIGNFLSFMKRLATGNAVFLSGLYYGAELWGPGLTLNQLQVLQSSLNRMAKWVTRNPVGASSKQNLMECGLLSVNQMVIFRILMVGLQAARP